MIGPRIRWVIKEPWRTTERNMRVFLKEGLRRALVFWWKRFLSLHFTTYAYTRYPGVFKKRVTKSGYRERRERGMGDIKMTVKRPLYWTGLTREMALSSMQVSGVSLGTAEKPTAYAVAAMSEASGEYFSFGSSHVVVKGVLTIPAYVGYLYGKGFNVNEELTTMNRQELAEMAGVALQYVNACLDKRQVQTMEQFQRFLSGGDRGGGAEAARPAA